MPMDIKGYQSLNDSCYRRWQTAMKEKNSMESYIATYDYKKNIEYQEKELQKMDPNSKNYEKASRNLDEQRNNAWEMEHEQRLAFSDSQMKDTYKELDIKNELLARSMTNAVNRGDIKTYESLREQYSKNLATKEDLGKAMKGNGIDFEEDSIHQDKVDLLNHDISMRNKISEKIEERELKGKKISEEDKIALDKYVKQVKNGEIELVKYQNDRKIQNMRERGESSENIKCQEEENERAQKWVESINR